MQIGVPASDFTVRHPDFSVRHPIPHSVILKARRAENRRTLFLQRQICLPDIFPNCHKNYREAAMRCIARRLPEVSQ
jgi:hypothetical protein